MQSRSWVTGTTLAALMFSQQAVAQPVPVGDLPVPLVRLREVEPGIVQDMRYAGADNFTGAPVAGYQAGECILSRATAEALAKVQRDLAPRHLSLKVYDCYRPVQAVAAFMAWVARPDGQVATRRFYPAVPKRSLVAQGYIASRSGHSHGNVVDLTLVATPPLERKSFDAAAAYSACTASAEQRAPDDSLDMGTGFDCFDVKSRVTATGLTAAQREARRTLVEAMRRRGFASYAKEWWHFSFPPGDPGRTFDVPVTAAPR